MSMPPEFDEYDLEILIAKIGALAVAIPPLVATALDHYRWHAKRRDKGAKRAHKRAMTSFQDYVAAEVARQLEEQGGHD